MALTMKRSSSSTSFSSRSISSSSGGGTFSMGGGALSLGTAALSLSGGMRSFQVQSRAPSVYGGAGGYGTRISQSQTTYTSGGFGASSTDSVVMNNEKFTMQNLNDRLASYLQKVRSLEEANRKLELQIREYHDKKTVGVSRDFSAYFATISDLQAKIAFRRAENQRKLLEIDNASLAAEDFKMKYETECQLRSMVDADVLRLRGVRDNLTLTIHDLESQAEGFKEELAYMKANHEEEMRQMRAQQRGCVNVEVDSAESADLMRILQDMRNQYEAVVVKNQQEVERWFQAKVDALQTTITTTTTEVKTFHSELSELKRSYQSYEINLQSLHTELQCLQQSLSEVKSRYSLQLSHLQETINLLEAELQHLKASIEQQKSEYVILLDIKMRLELEIAEYRRLLEGEHYEKKAVVISKVVEVEEHKPHIERRVKTIVEEIIDGKVVSSMVDTQVEDIQ